MRTVRRVDDELDQPLDRPVPPELNVVFKEVHDGFLGLFVPGACPRASFHQHKTTHKGHFEQAPNVPVVFLNHAQDIDAGLPDPSLNAEDPHGIDELLRQPERDDLRDRQHGAEPQRVAKVDVDDFTGCCVQEDF